MRQRPPIAASSETIVYNFGSHVGDGTGPRAGLIADKYGALYGTTYDGGSSSNPYCSPSGSGTVFKLTPSGSSYIESVLYSFQGGPADGANPQAGLVMDSHGALYGATSYGGSYGLGSTCGYGTVFKLTPSGSGYVESILHNFQGSPDGSLPMWSGALISDETGALYGTTRGGGSNYCSGGCGTVFKLTPAGSGYIESILHSFTGNDGWGPEGGLLAGKTGSLYGTTSGGGPGNVFELKAARKGYKLIVLYDFQGPPYDGSNPIGSLIAGKEGALYGTTYYGGNCALDGYGCGTVFELTRSGKDYTERILHSFQGSTYYGPPNDGAEPTSGLIIDKKGALYGTTMQGGSAWEQCGDPGGCGTVFQLTPSPSGYTESILHIFQGSVRSNDGNFPVGPLSAGKLGALYGTTEGGGAVCCGIVFKLTP